MAQPYQIQVTEDFFSRYQRIPRSYARKLVKRWSLLRTAPARGSNIKRVRGGPRGLYRLRIGDYRVVYALKDEPPAVLLLRIGPRGNVYDGLPPKLDLGRPAVDVISNASADDTVSEPPANGKSPPPPEDSPSPDDPLPDTFRAQVEDLGIPEPHLSALLKCCTEGELLNAKVPDDLQERIVEKLWPRPIDELLDVPKRVVDSAEDLLAAVDGSRSLESFLLMLDEKQKPLVARFRERPNGPWLVKGGPGTGKSTVALYCLRNLLRPDEPALPIVREPLRVLFTTYTKSLVAVSAHLLKVLKCGTAGIDILKRGQTGLAPPRF